MTTQSERERRRALRRLKLRAFWAGVLLRPNPVTDDDIRRALGYDR